MAPGPLLTHVEPFSVLLGLWYVGTRGDLKFLFWESDRMFLGLAFSMFSVGVFRSICVFRLGDLEHPRFVTIRA